MYGNNQGGVGTVSKRRKAAKIAAIILICHIALSFLTTKIIYDSIFGRYDAPDEAATASSLSDIMHPVSFPSGENMLSGKLFDGPGDSLVVIVQGIRSHAGNFACVIDRIVREDCRDVFIFDMTGSCESEGDSGIGFSQAIFDLHAALDYIDRAYDYDDIFLVGHSRGGYAACCVLPERTDIDGVVAINSPNSPMDAVMGGSVNTVGWLAYGNYPMLYLYQAMLFDFQTVSRSASDAIAQSNVPVLVIQAQQDETVRWDRFSIYAHKEDACDENVEFRLIDGGHSDVLYDKTGLDANRELWEQIEQFFSINCNHSYRYP